MITLLNACAAVQGTLYTSNGTVVELKDGSTTAVPKLSFKCVGIDTRKPLDGGLFIALKGPNHDAHDHLGNALKQGAVAVLTERYVTVDCPQIVVPNTYTALTDLASWWRREHEPMLVAITGSVGKTSVKTMLNSILSQEASTLSTLGNLNNEIGVPLTLLRLSESHRYAVIEMGMNAAGEIGRLTRLGAPNVALINNAAEAHLEGLGSLEAIAAAKGEIYEGLESDGIAIVNADDAFAPYWHSLIGNKKIITFGMRKCADVSARYVQLDDEQKVTLTTPRSTLEFKLAGRGQHNVMNALASATAALAAGASDASIVAGLESYQAVDGRLRAHTFGKVSIYDDTYNANPASVKAALSVVAEFAGSIAILGDMGELGPSAPDLHYQVGQYASEAGVKTLWSCGQYANNYVDGFNHALSDSNKASSLAFERQQDLLAFLATQPSVLSASSAVLVKGSRSAKMENVSNALIQRFSDAANTSSGEASC